MNKDRLECAESDATRRFGKCDAERAELGKFAPRIAIKAPDIAEGSSHIGGKSISGKTGDHFLQCTLVVIRIKIHWSTLPGKAEDALGDDVLLNL
jgi:hypothetical protein